MPPGLGGTPRFAAGRRYIYLHRGVYARGERSENASVQTFYREGALQNEGSAHSLVPARNTGPFVQQQWGNDLGERHAGAEIPNH